jgi:hypothetical protein
MDSTETVDWKDDARLLRAQGKSEREIAEQLGKSRSTIHETVKDVTVDDPDVLAGEDEFVAGEQPQNGNGHVDVLATSLAAIAGDSSGGPTPGQLDIDGGEAPAAEQVRVEEIIVRGTTPLDFFNLGGKLPNTASIRFVGGKVGLEQGTAFKKGEVIQFHGYATVVSATPRDKRDKATGVVLECELQIQAEIDDLQLGSG